jgi:hypothetical protein
VLRFTAACTQPVNALTVGYRLFADLDPQHKGLLKISHGGQVSTAIFGVDQPRQTLSLAAPSRWRSSATM